MEYVAADGGVSRDANAPMDHQQPPSVGEQVTIAYREQDRNQAVMLGYEGNNEFLGGIGVILTAVFTTLGLILIVTGLRRGRRDEVRSPNVRCGAAEL